MTCIVALVQDGVTYFAGDSLTVNVPHDFHDGGGSQTVRREPKVFQKNGMLFGYSGSVRMGQLLQYELDLPEYVPGTNKLKYLVSDFINAVQDGFEKAEFGREVLGGNILLAIEGELFTIGKAFHVCNTADHYESVGKASEVAIGSLHTTAQLGLPPLERLFLALKATERHTCVVSAPFTYITSEMEQPEILALPEAPVAIPEEIRGVKVLNIRQSAAYVDMSEAGFTVKASRHNLRRAKVPGLNMTFYAVPQLDALKSEEPIPEISEWTTLDI